MSPELHAFVDRAFRGMFKWLSSTDHRRLKRVRSKAVRRMRMAAVTTAQWMIVHENERALSRVRKEAKRNLPRRRV